ncbi:hypothetical protein [Aureivirga marina]|uniref:hypothetical protein n=1 Tax=Aureivirga marina TaxID=1182451 RepID=UPI0018CB6E60|nr:hypothetical protein [Aureivirga marina]
MRYLKFLLIFVLISCTKDKETTTTNKTIVSERNNSNFITLTEIFEEIQEISIKNNNASIEFQIEYGKNSKPSLLNYKIYTGIHPIEQGFQVDCWNGDGSEILWMETYETMIDALGAAYDCMELDGGCSEVCNLYARYYNQKIIIKK